MTAPRLKVFPDRASATAWLVDTFAQQHRIAPRPVTYLMPGGTTPRPFLEGIAALELDWGQTSLFPTDERVVPLASDRSNYRLLRNCLGATGANIQSLYHPRTGAQGSVDFLNDRPFAPVRLAVLGLGEDAHTASLFPGQPQNLAANGNAFLTRNPHDGTQRISLTYRLLAQAEAIYFFFFGAAKQAALRHLWSENYQPLHYPAQWFVRHFRGRLTLVTDEAAARPV